MLAPLHGCIGATIHPLRPLLYALLWDKMEKPTSNLCRPRPFGSGRPATGSSACSNMAGH